MRIIAGEFRSRRLQTPKDAETVRPIPDRVKESLFSLLRGHCEGARVFDLFAGTGAIGLEAVSRGAQRVVLVERDRDVASLLRENIAALGVESRTEVFVGDALGMGALARCPKDVNLAFMDPPYPVVRSALGFRRVMNQAQQVIKRLMPGGFLVLRTPWPLLIDAEDAPSGDDGGGRRAGHARTGAKRSKDDRRRKHKMSLDEIDAWESDQDEEVQAEEVDPEADADAPARVPADLKMPGAVGPETHVYHTMAVHLYMPARSDGTAHAHTEPL